MSFARFSSIVRGPLLFRQSLLARTILAHGFATHKEKPANVKRPSTAYQLFAFENRTLVVAEYPDIKGQEITKALSNKWKEMSEDEKSSYKKTYAENLKIYNAPLAKLPKKPPGTFGLFVKENYSKEAGLLPEAKLTEVMKALSNQWNNISNEEKEQWKQKQEEMKEEYKEKVISFDEGLTPEERAFLEEKRGPKMRQLAKEKSKLLGRPKRPLTAYIIFVQKNIRGMESPTGSTAVERIQTLAQTWNNMTSEEKEEYVVESRQAFEQYQKDVAEWKEKHPEAA